MFLISIYAHLSRLFHYMAFKVKTSKLLIKQQSLDNLKSGMPLAVLIPAPATTNTFLQRPSFTSRATGARPPRDNGVPCADLDLEDSPACTGSLPSLDIFPLLESKQRKDKWISWTSYFPSFLGMTGSNTKQWTIWKLNCKCLSNLCICSSVCCPEIQINKLITQFL